MTTLINPMNKVQIEAAAAELAQALIEDRQPADSLARRIWWNALRFAEATGAQEDVSDLCQEAVIVLIERSVQFDGQAEAFIAQAARWHIQHKAELGRYYRKVVNEMPVVSDGEGEQADLLELVADQNATDPEEAAEQSQEQFERAAIAGAVRAALPEAYRKIFDALARGERPSDIAKAMGV
jgi:RNA polymerase sigma factor (sigma-70 family)